MSDRARENQEIREDVKAFWQQFFQRHHNITRKELSQKLNIGNDAITRWISGQTVISPDNICKLIDANMLSPDEATRLIKLCLESLGFSRESLPTVAAALGTFPLRKNRLTVSMTRGTSDFPKLLAAAHQHIDIQQTYIPNAEAIVKNALLVALANGCQVRILLLKSDSSYLHARLDYLGGDISTMSSCITWLKYVANHSRTAPGTIEVRAYDAMPYFPFFRIDNRVFTGYYLQIGSSNYPHVMYSLDEVRQYFPDLLHHFEEYWNRPDNEVICCNRDKL
jgi:transcriptional regulator with XRE-family HTH domain